MQARQAGGWQRLKVRDAGDASLARARSATVSKGFCVVSICLLSRFWQRIRPMGDDDQVRDQDQHDADLLRCCSLP